MQYMPNAIRRMLDEISSTIDLEDPDNNAISWCCYEEEFGYSWMWTAEYIGRYPVVGNPPEQIMFRMLLDGKPYLEGQVASYGSLEHFIFLDMEKPKFVLQKGYFKEVPAEYVEPNRKGDEA